MRPPVAGKFGMKPSEGRGYVSVWKGGWFDPPETRLHVLVSVSLLILPYSQRVTT